MLCKKCGEKIGKDELFCPSCGYYVGDEDTQKLGDDEINSKEAITNTFEKEKFEIKDASATKKGEFSYENEDLLEAFIGEDYKLIKKSPFNIWAFLLNWMYLLYRKLYITGLIGLLLSWIVIAFFRKIIWIYLVITMLLLGFSFSKYYIFICKYKVEKIIKDNPDEDRFNIEAICRQKGGVNVVIVLIIYLVFLIIVFFTLVSFTYNKNHNTKFWQENSENKASCNSVIKTAYNYLEEENDLGIASDAVCEVIGNNNNREYKVYIKTNKDNNAYYSYYITENGYVSYKQDTMHLNELQLKKANSSLTEEEEQLLLELNDISQAYAKIFNESKKEDQLIQDKKNKTAKKYFRFNKEEIIR